MVSVKKDNFSLSAIAASGQCFRMKEETDGSFSVIAGDRFLRAYEQDKDIRFDCTEEEYESFWKDYFDLDTDYGVYINSVDPEDKFLTEACKRGSGIRILKQDIWEMTVTFLISQQNNITRIKRCIRNISEKYGRRLTAPDGTAYFSFPEPASIAGLDKDALMECNLGYRSKYVVRCAEMVAGGETDLEALRKLDHHQAREKLLELYGVGKKVADCICLFSLHHLEAFPIDTHINQVIQREYGGNFPFERYKGFEGVIQQYIFYHELTGK